VTGRAAVRLFGRHAGTLWLEGDAGIPEVWRFEYAADYLKTAAPALSV
jgi:hypothetical protein